MKQFNEAGKRLFQTDPTKGPSVEIWCGNHKDCIFCEHCNKRWDLDNPSNPKLVLGCKLMTIGAMKNNCLIHEMNKNHTCKDFKDIQEGEQEVVRIKRNPVPKQVENKTKAPSFNFGKNGVEER